MSGVASVASFNGSNASSAGSSVRSRSTKYRTVDKKSTVDENLFGSTRTTCSAPRERDVTNKTSPRSNSAPKKSNPPEVIQVITKDMIRKLRVPREDPSGCSLILKTTNFNRIKNSSRVLTKKEQLELAEQAKQEKSKLLENSEDRKAYMQEMEMKRRQNEKLSDLEQEAKDKSQYLLGKATEQMEEQEDEIKKLNESILNAKCHAIRDAQLIEKLEIKKEMSEEDKRLDAMMECDRMRALIDYENRDNAKRVRRLQGAQVLHQQIEEKEQQNLLELEKKDQETRAMLQYLDRLKKEDMYALVKKRENQQTFMKDVEKSNAEINFLKDQQREREKLEDYRVMEYLKDKSQREESFEKEREQLRIEKEKEIGRLRKQQEIAKDKQSEQNELRAKRNQEEAEREWRRKERLDVIKKTNTEKHLRNARQEQIANKDHFLAVQAARDRGEFERVLMAQRAQAKKDDLAEQELHHNRTAYAEDVRNQIKEKEKQRIQDRQSFFHEGIKLDAEAKERRAKLDEIKRRKLKELKEAGVPDKYVTEVARRIEPPPPSLSTI